MTGHEVGILHSLEDVRASSFDSLDGSAGAAGCYERLLQREIDGRWEVNYLHWAERGVLKAMVPLYAGRGGKCPDPDYEPSHWEIPGPWPRTYTEGNSILVGGCSDRRTGLHVDREHRDGGNIRRILVAIAGFAAAHNRALAFPFTYPQAREMIARATNDNVKWVSLGREACFMDCCLGDRRDSLPSRVKYVLRRDEKIIAETGVKIAICSWPEVEDSACELIAAHNTRKGQYDHPEFVRMRHREWDECHGVELIVFVVVSAGIRGVVTAFIWQGQLELYEVGLDGEEGPERLAAYIALVFREPLRFADERQLRSVRAGLAAEMAKASRGATLTGLYGGFLDAAKTRRLASDEL